MKKGFLIISAVLLLIIRSAVADVIVLNSGERRTGLVIESPSDPDNVVFESSVGEMKIARNRIARIEKEALDASYMHISRDYFGRQNFAKAKEYADKAIGANPANEGALQLIDDINKTIADRAQNEIKEQVRQVDANIEKLGELIKEQKLTDAQKLLELIERKELSTAQSETLHFLKVRLLYQQGMQAIDRLNPKGATEYFESALKLDPNNQEVFNQLLALWQNDPNMANKVISIYEERLKNNPGNIELSYTIADLYYKQRNLDKALPYLVNIKQNAKTADSILDSRLREALTSAHENAAATGQFEKAAEVYNTLLKLYPNEDPTILYFYQYSAQLATLSPDDITSHIALGDFCRERGLDNEALERYTFALEKDPKNQKALEGVKFYAQKDLAEINSAFTRKDYDTVIYKAGILARNFPNLSDVISQGNELKERAENELRRETRETKARALALARRGDEFYATAESHANALKSTERKTTFFVMNDKEEAKKFYRRAIDTWEAALSIDSSLGSRETEDLNTKIGDARARLFALSRVIPIATPKRTIRTESK